jgi:hypothetical protein
VIRNRWVNVNTEERLWSNWHTASLIAIVVSIFLIEVFLPSVFRLWCWLGVMGLLALFALIAGHGVTGLWLGLLIDSRNKLSLSRLQLLLWTVMILSGFLAAVLTNIEEQHSEPLSVSIPAELWLLMGISTSSLVGSPLILNLKKARPASEERKAWALEQLARQAVDITKIAIHGQIVVNQTPQAAHWGDLFRGSETGNAGQLDIGKLQMFFFTLVLVLAYGAGLAALFNDNPERIAALPTVDGGMLALLGISHAGYLMSKAIPYGEAKE